ncbi:MAG: DUF447 domain-containing protein, partial [Candidatus Methanofastidiosia archaeon]
MIFETILSTLEEDVNFAPMGVVFKNNHVLIRPFKETKTFENLSETKVGVINLTDNVSIFAKSAVSDEKFPTFNAKMVRGVVLKDACSWYEVKVESFKEKERAEFLCKILYHENIRNPLFFNRARSCVMEASILATRLHKFEKDFVLSELERFKIIVKKTGGKNEREAFSYIESYIGGKLNA